MNNNKSIEVLEVGPRDGFQSVCNYIPLQTKLAIIEKIIEAGVQSIQITSFVSPKAIPQMQDAKELAKACLDKYPQASLSALVPNFFGAKTAAQTGLKNIAYVVSLSESHNHANIKRSHEESFDELRKIQDGLPQMDICLDLATAFGCPFEGKKEPEENVAFLRPYVDLGIGTVNLCDTIGVANPAQVRETIAALNEAYPELKLQIHIHDTRNMGMVNTLAAIESGVKTTQSTLGGLGGCPFAPGASGNLATEDLVHMLSEMGYDTGIDEQKLIEAAKYESEHIDGIYSGHILKIDNAIIN
ncbi:MAG: hydroxymethylglutaryl-CoA lyase [Brevefilum sp.]